MENMKGILDLGQLQAHLTMVVIEVIIISTYFKKL